MSYLSDTYALIVYTSDERDPATTYCSSPIFQQYLRSPNSSQRALKLRTPINAAPLNLFSYLFLLKLSLEHSTFWTLHEVGVSTRYRAVSGREQHWGAKVLLQSSESTETSNGPCPALPDQQLCLHLLSLNPCLKIEVKGKSVKNCKKISSSSTEVEF